jgi:hypothetical protein
MAVSGIGIQTAGGTQHLRQTPFFGKPSLAKTLRAMQKSSTNCAAWDGV